MSSITPRPTSPSSGETVQMGKYVGAKIILATPMDEVSYLRKVKGDEIADQETRPGYLVRYPSDARGVTYDRWSPKDVFENAYREITDGEINLIS